ncbi:sushi, von Willebrand factor type A, EGF and pentraxin domain-containing protein 1-like isoform X2 [Oculina patagonica]
MMWIASHMSVVTFIICIMEKVLITNQERAEFHLADYQDTQPPDIKCPDDFLASTDPNKPTKRVEWRWPMARDNSGDTPLITSLPHDILSPYEFPIGTTRIIYTAKDRSGNSQSCVFTVTITDDEPPKLTCPQDIHVKTNAGATVNVHWPLPAYEDNSGGAVTLFTESVQGTGFRVGQNQIKYVATDLSGNTASCTFAIVVSGPTCGSYAPPLNGLMACSHTDMLGGTVCTPQCNLNKDFSRIPANMYICQSSGEWYAWDFRPTVSRAMPWPDCTDVVNPGALQKGAFWQNFAGDCSDPSVQTQAQQNLLRGLGSVFGSDLGLQESDVTIACGQTKKKRSVLSSR